LNKRRVLCFRVMFCLLLCVTLSGCSLLQLPVKMVEGTFGLLGEILKLANKLPMPPPWLF
jgi:hypothetical protein